MIDLAGLAEEFEIVINQTDRSAIFDDLAFLLVPSRKESFGNSVVEALSFGVPVIAPSYAPGPAEIIQDSISGFLLDEYSGLEISKLLGSVTHADLECLSHNAFLRHKDYRIDDHIDQIEEWCMDILTEFNGENILPVYPSLKVLEG